MTTNSTSSSGNFGVMVKRGLTREFHVFPKLTKPQSYQFKCAFLLTGVPLVCALFLTALIFFFAQQNLYFLENGGLLISEEIRQAYHDKVLLELVDVSWYIFALFALTFGISYFLMGWAVSPFINAERVLRKALEDPNCKSEENDWFSESPTFHHVIWGMVQRLKDPSYQYDAFEEPTFQFSYRFMLKFCLSFLVVSFSTGAVLGIMITTVYNKIIDLAISLMRLSNQHYYFLAQEELLRTGVFLTILLSCFTYLVIGYYVTRYLSNMVFVFARAVKLHHFPLKLRDSDIYHDLAWAISELARRAGLSK